MDSFFGIGPFELVFILIFALIFLGPERLPGVMRETISVIRKIRSLSSEITQQFNEELGDLAELDPRRQMQDLLEDPAKKKAAQQAGKTGKTASAKSTTAKSTTAKSAAAKSTTAKSAAAKSAAAKKNIAAAADTVPNRKKEGSAESQETAAAEEEAGAQVQAAQQATDPQVEPENEGKAGGSPPAERKRGTGRVAVASFPGGKSRTEEKINTALAKKQGTAESTAPVPDGRQPAPSAGENGSRATGSEDGANHSIAPPHLGRQAESEKPQAAEEERA